MAIFGPILGIIALIIGAWLFLTISSNRREKEEKIEEKIDHSIEQKSALADIIMFLCENIPNKNDNIDETNMIDAVENNSFNNLKRDIFLLAEDIKVRYSNDEELEKQFSSILKRTGVYVFR